jgi:tetratricopeptide (TPR) repeat protein
VALVDLLARAGQNAAALQELTIAAADAEALADDQLLTLVLVHRGSLAIDAGERALAQELLDRARPAAEADGGRVLAELLLTQGWLDHINDDLGACVAAGRAALACGRAVGDGELELRALHLMSIGASRLGHFDEAEAQLREALGIAGRLGNTGREAMLLNALGGLAHVRAAGDPAGLPPAIELYQRSGRLYEALGVASGMIAALGNLAQAEIEAGLLDEGARHVHEVLLAARRRDLYIDIGFAVMVRAQLAITAGDVAAGLRLIGAAVADRRGDPRPDEVDRILRLYGITPEQAEVGMAVGRELDLDTVVEELLADPLRRWPRQPDE